MILIYINDILFHLDVLYYASLTELHNNIHTFPISHSYVSDEPVHEEEDQINRLVDRFFVVETKNVASIAMIPESE